MLLVLFVLLVFADCVSNAVIFRWEQHPETLEELMLDQRTLVEGDIYLPKDRNAVGETWPTTDIPYEISPEVENRTSDILVAMETVSKHTCITFHKRGAEPDYVLFKIGNGCASYVGYIGGGQGLFVAPPCSSGNIIHELLHTIGFQHEHTRSDRDQFIEIVQDNILPGMEKNFIKLNGKTFGIPYDYTSIMHYGRNFFSSNGKATIIPKKDDVHGMGQRKKLMDSDIKKVQLLYHCDSLEPKGTMDN
ncbi:astacin-like metalloendopeptidase isoform X2 [Kryptolebias marmoratus]|uniref:astacin-like metalloendopeptidase isoform X2 n=1 Tax=Kryptolebias marmoratus TaxID=37003 RepID=UPI0007F93B2E|nr:astacin-like metalloendopeptidase isoform X2 [Kryptolebias marmoratus]